MTPRSWIHLAMRTAAALVVLLTPGCSCDHDLPSAPLDDAGAEPLDDAGALASLDAGDVFALPDASSAPLPVACREIERTTTALPPLALGQVMLRGHEDRLLLIERPNLPGTAGGTPLFRFYTARQGEPFVLLASYEQDRQAGVALEARWRDGGWDVILDVFSHEGLVQWLRLSEDGAIDVREIRGPIDRRIRELEVRAVGDDIVVLGREDDDGASGPPWLAVLSPDGAAQWIDLTPPPGGGRVWQVVPRLDEGSVLVLARRSDGRAPARLATVPLDPLRAPGEGDWVDLPGPYAAGEHSYPTLHDTPAGLVLTEFLARTGEPARLRVAWWDSALRTVASWSIETGVRGHVAVVGAPPAQEIFLALPDHDASTSPATIFHARVAAPGVVSTPAPIGRTRSLRPPEVVLDAEGRAQVLHFDERVDVERVCEVRGGGAS